MINIYFKILINHIINNQTNIKKDYKHNLWNLSRLCRHFHNLRDYTYITNSKKGGEGIPRNLPIWYRWFSPLVHPTFSICVYGQRLLSSNCQFSIFLVHFLYSHAFNHILHFSVRFKKWHKKDNITNFIRLIKEKFLNRFLLLIVI